MDSEGAKPLRADARRNRERVLSAAREAFAAEGIVVPLDEIARRAGVGAGTVYRHFPTKDTLFEAIVLDNLRARTHALRELQQEADPASALAEFFVQMLENGAYRALRDGLGQTGTQLASDEAVQVSAEFYEALDGLLRRGQQEGSLRADLTAKHVKAMLIGVLTASDWLGGEAEERRRLASIVCDGFRATRS